MDITHHYRELGLAPGASYEDILRTYRWRMLAPIDDGVGANTELRRRSAVDAFIALKRTVAPTGRIRKTVPPKSELSGWREAEVFQWHRAPLSKTEIEFSPAQAPVIPADLSPLPKPTAAFPPHAPVGSTLAIAACVVVAVSVILNLPSGKTTAAFQQTNAASNAETVAVKPPDATTPAIVAPPAPAVGRIIVRTNRPGVKIELAPVGDPRSVPTAREADRSHDFTNLVAGEYRVIARLEGWAPIPRTVTALPGQAIETAFEFKTGSIRLESDPANAVVRYGNREVGRTPLVLSDLPPVSQTFAVQYEWWPEARVTRTILEEKELKVTVRFPRGGLAISSSPSGATVSVAGVELGLTPLQVKEMPAGQHKLQIKAAEFQSYEAAVTIADGAELRISPVLISSLTPLVPNDIINLAWSDNGARTQRQGNHASRPKNGVVKNFDRQALDNLALGRRFRFSSAVRSYDAKSGKLEFREEDALKSKYRVVANLSATARSNSAFTNRLLRGAVVEISGTLTGVEEPRWPSKVIIFEIDQATPVN